MVAPLNSYGYRNKNAPLTKDLSILEQIILIPDTFDNQQQRIDWLPQGFPC